jgi:4-alpha-glucanotransferase
MNLRSSLRFLHRLARLYGIQPAYYDMERHRHQASVEALLLVLRSLGAPVASLQDVPSAWRERWQAVWQRPLEPVAVAWDGEPLLVEVRLPSNIADSALNCQLRLESGERRQWEWHGADLPLLEAVEVEGAQYVVKQLPLPDRLPWGYHQFSLEVSGKREESLIISAPLKAYTPQGKLANRVWGVFVPLYALHTQRNWGSGNFSDMEALMAWLAETGGRVIATLPFLATFRDEGSEPSPYLPASRLLWDEFYLDITRVPELQRCPPAQALLASSQFQQEIKALRDLSLVDYCRQMALKRQVLEKLCQCFFAEASDRLYALQRFAEAYPVVADYARFRATGEKQHCSWWSWPQPLRGGILKEGDYDEENQRYHLYVQWLAHEQTQALSEKAKEKGLQLYLDLPLGVHPDGYDVWREQSVFALNVSVGAPPDTVFTTGQDWGFPPLHPQRIREQGYRYPIAYLCHHLQHADILRIDHVMGLHRLFWIPNGLEASQGVYVRYRAEELYAILALESQRNKVLIVGEDLGTVPPEVRPAMSQHGLYRMCVMHYELASNPQMALRRVPSNSIASLNTHDMPPFAAFWQGVDIEQRLELGLLDKAEAAKERENRQAIRESLTAFLQDRGGIKQTVDTYAALKVCLDLLSASRARIVLVNLEDLWLEIQSQNVPSTMEEYPNWRHKARYSLEEFCHMPQVIDILRSIDRIRKQGRYQR